MFGESSCKIVTFDVHYQYTRAREIDRYEYMIIVKNYSREYCQLVQNIFRCCSYTIQSITIFDLTISVF